MHHDFLLMNLYCIKTSLEKNDINEKLILYRKKENGMNI